MSFGAVTWFNVIGAMTWFHVIGAKHGSN